MNSPVRVSCASLCRFVVDAHYLLLLNRNRRQSGIYELSPVGGAIEFYDLAIIPRFNMSLEDQNVLELRFFTEQTNIDAFCEWFYQRQGRECDPFREIFEELVEEARLLDQLTQHDVQMSYLHTVESIKPTKRSGVTDIMTQYFLEIFEVRVISEAVAHQLRQLDQSTGAVLVDETTARQAKSMPLKVDGAVRQARLNTEMLFRTD